MFLKKEEKEVLRLKGRDPMDLMLSQYWIEVPEYASTNKLRRTASPLDLSPKKEQIKFRLPS